MCWGGLSCFICVRLCATLWTRACEAPLSLGFSRQEYWSGLPSPSPGDLSDPGMEHTSLALASRFFTAELLGKPFDHNYDLREKACVKQVIENTRKIQDYW